MRSRDERRDALADAVRAAPGTRVPAAGLSMGPALARAEALVVRGLAHARPRAGSVVLYRRAGLWIAHRLILPRGGGWLALGDGNDRFDAPPVREEEMLGVVTAAVVDGREVALRRRDRARFWLRGIAKLLRRA